MKKNEKKQKKFLFCTLMISLVIILVLLFIIRLKNQTTTFESTFQRFKLNIPDSFYVKEDITFVDITSEKGKINVSRIASNYQNLTDYLNSFDSKRSITILSQNAVKINDYESIVTSGASCINT